MRHGLLLFLFLAGNGFGATYYVSITGSDAANGSIGTPWRTVQKAENTVSAGDTVIVSTGDYAEYVSTVTSGTSGSKITFVADPENDPSNPVHVKQFRIKHQHHIVRGFRIGGATDINNAHVRIDAPGSNNGSDFTLTNCTIADTPFVISTNASFGSNFVHITDGNFNTAGFTAGSLVFFGADSLYAFTNHGTAHTTLSNSTDGLTMYVSDTLLADTGTNYWAVVVPGQDNSTFKGVMAPLGASFGASNVVIANCLFTNLFGPALILTGNSNRVIGNEFTKLHGQYAMQIQTVNSVYAYNFIHDNANIEWFTQEELNGAQHPLGGTYYDWQCNITAGFATDSTNNLFTTNWIQNCDNQLSQIEDATNSTGFTISYCVFVGLMQHGSMSRNNMTFDHNTFYRTAYTIDETTAIGAGGTHGSTMTNPIVTSNLFVDNGEHANPSSETPFTLSTYTNAVLSNNVSVTAETMGYVITPSAAGFVTNAGDPLFINPRNPLGADGRPFTSDDGLRPLTNSYVARLGAGALAPIIAGSTTAHFRQTTVTSWRDATGTNYDTAWAALKPHQRTTVIRPYATPEAVGTVPTNIIFDASQSLDGIGTNNAAVRFYSWNFGDGCTIVSRLPIVSHLFTVPNVTNIVTLTITNLYGSSSTYSNLYRTLGTNSTAIRYVATNGNDTTGNGTYALPWRTIQKAQNSSSGGWVISVGPGDYDETVDCTVNASGSRIFYVGRGASTKGFNMRNSTYTVDGFALKGSSTVIAPIYLYATVSNIVVANCTIGPFTNNVYGVWMSRGATGEPDVSASWNTISNCWFQAVDYIQVNCMGQSNTFLGLIQTGGNGQNDFFRVWGKGHVIDSCEMFDVSLLVENHTDFYQIFGPDTNVLGRPLISNDYDYAQNIVIQNCIARNSHSQICQLENFQNPAGYFTNIIFRNMVFDNMLYAANVDMDGTKWYNNLFYKVNTGNLAHVFAFGGTKGNANGTEIKNCAFVACGNGTTLGWYPIIGDAGVTNWSLTADYNFVCQSNYAAFAQAPPDGSGKFRSDGQDVHGINGGDPLFVSIANSDFRFSSSSSPLVSAGANLSSQFTTDILGVTRPGSGAWDIGPFQFAAGSGTSTATNIINSVSGRIVISGSAILR